MKRAFQAVGVALVLFCAIDSVTAQDTTTMLSKFLTGLRSGRWLMQGGTIPTVTSCGTGAVLAGSKDSAGQVTVTGATACTIVFSSAWTNAPFCIAENLTANRGFIDSISTTQIVLSTITDGDVIQWVCVGVGA